MERSGSNSELAPAPARQSEIAWGRAGRRYRAAVGAGSKRVFALPALLFALPLERARACAKESHKARLAQIQEGIKIGE